MSDQKQDLDSTELRCIVALRVLSTFLSEEGQPPRQRELVGGEGLLQAEWVELGVDVKFPWGFRTPAQLSKAIKFLREADLAKGEGYCPLPAGIDLALTYGDDWENWEPITLEA